MEIRNGQKMKVNIGAEVTVIFEKTWNRPNHCTQQTQHFVAQIGAD